MAKLLRKLVRARPQFSSQQAYHCLESAQTGAHPIEQSQEPLPRGRGTDGRKDVFEREWAGEPRVAPDGKRVVYRRMGFDLMQDQRRGNLWLAVVDGEEQRNTHQL